MGHFDKSDRRLLYALSLRPEATAVELDREARLSPDQVRYRLGKYQSDGRIFMVLGLIPLERLGAEHYYLRLRLRSASVTQMQALTAYLAAQESVTWIARLQGMYDLGFSLRCFSRIELRDFIDALLENYSSLILERSFNLYAGLEYLGFEFLTAKRKRTLRTSKRVDGEPKGTLDAVDYVILEMFAKNGRVSNADIARELEKYEQVPSLSREAVAYRVQQLRKENWLAGSWVILNPAMCDHLYCKVCIRVETPSGDVLEKFLNDCREDTRVIFLFRLIGEWDYEIDLLVDSMEEASLFVMEMTERNPRIMRDYSISLVSSLEKSDYSQTVRRIARNKGLLP